jgi:cobalt-zinc-cadmium efflux system outer membrane protein
MHGLFWLALLSALAVRAAAAEPGGTAVAQDTVRITWDLLQERVATHPGFESARADSAWAAGSVRAAAAIPNPTVEAHRLTVDNRTNSVTRREREFALAFPLDWLWTRSGALRSARAGRDVARADLELRQRELLLEAGENFWSLVQGQALLATEEELDRAMQELLQAISARVQVGQARPVEASRVEVEALQERLGLEAARRALALSQTRLAQWLAPGSGVPTTDADLFELLPLDNSPSWESAAEKHPRLVAAKARIEQERGNLAVERLRIVPEVTLLGGLELAEDRHARAVGVGLTLPLFNQNRGRTRQAAASLRSATAELEVERRALRGELAEALAAFELSREQARSYREQILPRVEETAQALQRAWELGESDLFPLIDARRTLGSTRKQALLACGQAQLDRLRLQLLLETEVN